MNAPPNVLVVGVSGLIGRNTAKFLRDHNFRVRGVSRGPGEYQTAGALQADLTEIDLRFGDIADQSFADTALRGVERVVFAAGVSGVAASFLDPDASRRGTVAPWLSLLKQCRPGTRIVLMSSQLVYGPSDGRAFTENDAPVPASPYASNLALMEREGARWANQGKLEVVSLRLGNVFGDIVRLDQPRSHGLVALMLRDLLTRHEIRLFGGGKQTVSLLHVHDLAVAMTRVFHQQNDAAYASFNVSGETLSIRSVAESLRKGVGSGKLVSVPWPPRLEGAVARDIQLDDSRFRTSFGWLPERSVPTELELLAQSCARQYGRSPHHHN